MKLMSDEILIEMLAQNGFLRHQNEVLAKQIAHLTEQIVELKRDGFARPQPQLAAPYEHEKVDDRIMAAIRSVAREGSALEGELMQFANAALLADAEIEDVADRILAGSSLGDEDG